MTDSHLTARQLASYQAGQLSPGEEDEVQEHLTACRACTELLLSLPEFQELMEAEDLEAVARPEELPSPSETQASWQAVRARLEANRPAPAPAPPPPKASRFRRLTTSPTTVMALAASLLACLIGFPLWIATHGGPDAPVAVYPLGDGEITRGTRDSGQPFTLRLGEAPAVLALPVPPRAAFPSYRIEVWTPGGELRLSAKVQPVATVPGSADQPPRLVALALARGQLAAGDYRLRLVGERGDHGEVLAEHVLRVPAL